ncbi:MAG: hypothetical protein IPF63_13640 [Bacteroidetes bacterium]|nr:hypothetical protein [Bacteroidota bacterium]
MQRVLRKSSKANCGIESIRKTEEFEKAEITKDSKESEFIKRRYLFLISKYEEIVNEE